MLPGQKNRCFFVFPHVAMRAIFNELGAMAGSTDFLVDAEVNALATKFDLVSSWNAEHCKHETEFMLPALKAIHAEEAAKWDADHAATHNADAAVSAAIKDVLKVEGNDARISAGIKAYQQVLKNIAHYMEHMLYEETVLTPIFNRKMTDAQIEEVEHRLQAAVSPAFRQAITPYFLKAHNSHGRAFVLNMIKHTAPVPEIYAGVCGLAKSLLTAQEIQAVEKVLGYNLA